MTLKTSVFFGALLAASVGFANDNKSVTTPNAQDKALHGAADESKSGPGYMATANMNLKEGVNYQVLSFPKGSAALTSAQKRQLKSLADASKGDIDSIHVAVWSDMAFPKTAKADLPDAQEKLAEKRIETIEKYLDDDLDLDGIETYSMAESSNWFSRAFNTEEGELKSLFSQQGAPARIDSSEFKIVRTKGGPSKAVILIERESEGDQPVRPTTK
jgi:hypothetical protein